MKYKLDIIFAIITTIMVSLSACEPPITFTEPQPADTDNLSRFPKRLHGQYVSLADGSMLLISDKLIQRIQDYDYKIHIAQLDSNSRLSGDTVTDLRTNEKFFIKRKGDTLVSHVHYIDTLFQLNYDNVVRKFKGYYFLNTRYDKESWEVKKMILSKGELTISGISKKLELDNLKEIAESPQDTVPPYKFTVTKVKFKEFIKNDGFTDDESFIRQKKDD